MQTVNFKTSGFLYYFHKILYKYDPSDTCTYKSELILSFIINIATIHATLLRGVFMLNRNFREDSSNHGHPFQILFIAISILSTFMGFSILESSFDIINWGSLSSLEFIFYSFIPYFVGISILTLIFLVSGLLVFSVYQSYNAMSYIYQKFILKNLPFKNLEEGEEPKTQIGVLHKSAKERWCKKINWK